MLVSGGRCSVLVLVWNLSGILDLDDWNVSSWETDWNLRAGIQSSLRAGSALPDYWWLVLGRAVSGSDGWDRGRVDAATWVSNTGGGADGAGRGCCGSHEASLSGGCKIWKSAHVTWVSWEGSVPDWALVSGGGGNVGSLVSLAVDHNNDDDDNLDADDDWAGSDRRSSVWWRREDGGCNAWSGGGDHGGGKDRGGCSLLLGEGERGSGGLLLCDCDGHIAVSSWLSGVGNCGQVDGSGVDVVCGGDVLGNKNRRREDLSGKSSDGLGDWLWLASSWEHDAELALALSGAVLVSVALLSELRAEDIIAADLRWNAGSVLESLATLALTLSGAAWSSIAHLTQAWLEDTISADLSRGTSSVSVWLAALALAGQRASIAVYSISIIALL